MKQDFRKNCIKRLKKYSKNGRLKKDIIIIDYLIKIIKQNNAKNILLYIPLIQEVDVLPLIHKLRQNRLNIFVHYMNGKTLKIVPFRYPLEVKKFNVREPKNSNMGKRVKLDLAVVPIVGFDSTHRRIGYGAGFYDRFFDGLEYKPVIVFIQRCICKSNGVLTESHDIKGEYIVTNKGIINE
jgi:5-formyltetrahydrofolate cyclo-ligase